MNPPKSPSESSREHSQSSQRLGASDHLSLAPSIRSELSVASYNARAAGRRVRITSDAGYSTRSTWTGRTKTIKDSVINLQTFKISPEESEDSISYQANSILEIVLHCLKTWLGLGILAMPYAFCHSGWVAGIVFIALLTAAFRYCFDSCLRILTEVKTAQNNENLRFHDAMTTAFQSGPNYIKWMHCSWPYMWKIMYSIHELGICSTYKLFMAQSLAQIFQDNDILFSIRIWVIYVYGVILLVILIPDLRRVMPFSVVGVFLQLLGFILIIYFLCTNMPPLKELDMNRPIEMYAIFLGVVCFEYGPITFVSLFSLNSSYTPISVTVAATILAVLNCCIGFFGYWRYADKTLPSIILNLPNAWEFPHWIRLLFIVGIFLFYINHLYSLVHPIWYDYVNPKITNLSSMWKKIIKYLIKFSFVTTGMAIVVLMPRLGLLMSTFAILPNLLFGFVFVPLAEFCLFWPERLGYYKWIAVKNITLAIFGVLLAFLAFIINLYFLFNSFHQGEGYDFLPCKPNSTSGTLKIYCDPI